MVYYAELDENNICVGVSELTDYVEDDSLLEIESYDISLLGKLYDDGVWKDPNEEESSEDESQEEESQEEEPENEPSEEPVE